MKDMRNIKCLVIDILSDYPETRNSDDLLYIMVCKRLTNIDGLSFEKGVLEGRKLGLPKFASVSRARRLAQQYSRNLRASEKVIEGRYENYKAVKEFVSGES